MAGMDEADKTLQEPGLNKALTGKSARQGVLSLTIRDKNLLYSSYMPYIRNGGLFVPTSKKYHIGDSVFMLLTLDDSAEKFPVAGTVVWITPQGAGTHKPAGIGVQFSDVDQGAMRGRIETLLAGMVKSDRQTYTM